MLFKITTRKLTKEKRTLTLILHVKNLHLILVEECLGANKYLSKMRIDAAPQPLFLTRSIKYHSTILQTSIPSRRVLQVGKKYNHRTQIGNVINIPQKPAKLRRFFGRVGGASEKTKCCSSNIIIRCHFGKRNDHGSNHSCKNNIP